MEHNELTHWGIKGMKWGIRRYQNKDGSLTAAGKKRRGKDDDKKEESYEEKKQRALKSGSAKEVLQFKGDLTQQEMKTAMERIRWEQDMASIASKEVSAGKARADKLFKTVGDVTDYANTGAKAWNTFANFYNAFGGKSGLLPKIDTNIQSGNRAERKAEKKEQQKAEEAKKKREEQEAQRESKQKERAKKKAAQEAESKQEDSSERETYSGEVHGEGTSKSKIKQDMDRDSQRRAAKSASTIINNMDNVSADSRNISAGKSFVAGLLDEPK